MSMFLVPCGDECFPEDYQIISEHHGTDECPTAAKPCSPEKDNLPATCAGLTIDKILYSIEFDDWILLLANPFAKVGASFDDLGSMTGKTETINCPLPDSSKCASCSFNGQEIVPKIELRPNNKFVLRLDVHAQNAYWGGPYGVSAWAEFFFRKKP